MTRSGTHYGPLPEHLADVQLPDDAGAPVLVYFHGGGLESGDKADASGLVERLVPAGVGVVSAAYRLYPEARFPDFVEDAATCVAWVRHTWPDRPLLVGGSSASAYLAMMMCFDERWLAAAGADVADVVGWVFDAGQPTTHFNVLRERGLDPRRVVVDEASPLYHVGTRGELAPVLLVLASEDVAGRLEQTNVLLATLRELGLAERVRVEVMEGYQHSAYLGEPEGLSRFADLALELVRRSVAAAT